MVVDDIGLKHEKYSNSISSAYVFVGYILVWNDFLNNKNETFPVRI